METEASKIAPVCDGHKILKIEIGEDPRPLGYYIFKHSHLNMFMGPSRKRFNYAVTRTEGEEGSDYCETPLERSDN